MGVMNKVSLSISYVLARGFAIMTQPVLVWLSISSAAVCKVEEVGSNIYKIMIKI